MALWRRLRLYGKVSRKPKEKALSKDMESFVSELEFSPNRWQIIWGQRKENQSLISPSRVLKGPYSVSPRRTPWQDETTFPE